MVVGRLQLFPKLADFIRGVDRPAAQIEHRTFGGVNHRGGIAHALSAEFWRGGTFGPAPAGCVDFNFCGLDILRNVYPHRARAAGLRNAERIADNLRKLGRCRELNSYVW